MMAAPPPKTPRTCSQCGNNGHNARTCTELSAASSTTHPPHQTPQPIFIFGVNISESPPSPPTYPSTSMRKSMSMNNMYEQQHQQNQQSPHNDSSSCIANSNDNVGDASGYASDDALHVSLGNRTRERKRGIPWTEDEHRLFLMGLDKVGKGDWRGIARNYVKTRTPTQVASHAQKYFLRRTNVNRRRRRSSLFDITTDTMSRSSSDSQLASRDATPYYQSTSLSSPYPPTPLRPNSTKHARSIPTLAVPPSSKMASLNLNHSPTSSPSSSTSTYTTTKDTEYEPLLSLKLSPPPLDEDSSRRARSPPFGGFNGSGDSIISVA